MAARIYRPARTAMQSGRAKTGRWVLAYERETPRTIEPLMGYTAGADMDQQIRLNFATREEAVAYAERHGIAYEVAEDHDRSPKPLAYADNFSAGRPVPWTH